MVYADTTWVQKRLKGYSDDLDDDILAQGLDSADVTINTKLKKELRNFQMPSTVPTEIVMAANYYAAADILDILFDNEENRSAVAKTYESKADAYLESYIDSYLEQNPTSNEGARISIMSVHPVDSLTNLDS